MLLGLVGIAIAVQDRLLLHRHVRCGTGTITGLQDLGVPISYVARRAWLCDSIGTMYDASAIELDTDSTLAVQSILTYKGLTVETSI